eukprot:3225051-Alexandrium_andersonii.AAC.1
MSRSLFVQLPRADTTAVTAESSCHPLQDWAMSHWDAWGCAGIAMARCRRTARPKVRAAMVVHEYGGSRASAPGWSSDSKMGQNRGRKWK